MSELTSGNNSTGAHYESYKGAYSDYYAGEEYNVFANTFFVYNSNLYDYVIDSVDELRVLIDYYKVKCESNQFITIDISCRLETLVKYTQEEGSIHVKMTQRIDHTLDFLCEDNGIGMSPAFLEQIFVPFERVNTAAINKIEGTGLGMSIVKAS